MTSATAAAAPVDLDRLRNRVVETRRVATSARVGAHVLVVIVAALIGWTSRILDDPRPPFALAEAIAFGVLMALAAGVADALTTRYRAPILSAYLAALAERTPGGGLFLEIRDRELTALGRAAALSTGVVVVAVVVAWLLGRVDATALLLAVFGALIVGAWFIFEAEERSDRLSRPRILKLEANSTGLAWHRVGGERIALGWHQIRGIVRRAGPFRTTVWIDTRSGAPRRTYPPRYSEPESGEMVDLLTVAAAIRPDAFVARRRLRPGAIETVLEPTGLTGR